MKSSTVNSFQIGFYYEANENKMNELYFQFIQINTKSFHYYYNTILYHIKL